MRHVVPRVFYFGEVSWHPGPQWLLDAWDNGKDAMRTFALCDVLAWGDLEIAAYTQVSITFRHLHIENANLRRLLAIAHKAFREDDTIPNFIQDEITEAIKTNHQGVAT